MLVAAVGSMAFAQFDHAPFDADAIPISAGFGAEMSVIRLRAAAAMLEDGESAEEVEEVLEGLRLEVMRFGAALAAADGAAADGVDAALASIDEADDDDLADTIAAALPIFEAARDAVVPADPSLDPPYTAAVMTLLLTSGSGVAEGYEEAVEGETGPYVVGWAALARVQELWGGLGPLADDNQRFEIDDMFADLAALFPSSTIPASAASADPEEAEGPAFRLTGFLESLASASLFPNRDLAALLINTRDLTDAGCAAYAAGERRQAEAHLAWTAFAFTEYLGDTLGLFEPQATAEVEAALASLVPLADEEEEGGAAGASRSGDGADDGAGTADDASSDESDEAWTALSDADAADTCTALVDALQRSGAMLGL